MALAVVVVVEVVEDECGRGERGGRGEAEVCDQAGEEEVDSVSAVEKRDSASGLDVVWEWEWRIGLAHLESQPFARGGVRVGERDGECVDMVLSHWITTRDG